VVVVGSGVAGASVAFALAGGGADVTVVDRVRPGQATAAGAGIVQPWSSGTAGPAYDLYAAGAAHYPALVERLAAVGVSDLGYRVTGSLVVDPDPARLDEVEDRVRRRTAGVAVAGAVERLGARDARALFPPLAPDLGAVLVSGGARVDGRRLRSGLLAGAGRLGATVLDTPARVEPAGGSWVVRTPDGDLGADAVVVAAGAWTDEVLAPLGVRLAVEPQRGQLVHLSLAGTDTAAWPSVLPPGRHYLLPFDAGRVVVGATRETGSGFDPRVTAAGLREVLDAALSVAPGLAAASVLETRVGLRPRAPRPVLGPVPDRPGLYVCTGFGSAGLTMAPVAGDALARSILGRPAGPDLGPFAPAGR
jgi:D-amino-acid dehydrogenase